MALRAGQAGRGHLHDQLRIRGHLWDGGCGADAALRRGEDPAADRAGGQRGAPSCSLQAILHLAPHAAHPRRVWHPGAVCRLPAPCHQGGTCLCHHDQHLRVRQDLLPEAEPRAAAAGVVSWARAGWGGGPRDSANPLPTTVPWEQRAALSLAEPKCLGAELCLPAACAQRQGQPGPVLHPQPPWGTSVPAAVTLGGSWSPPRSSLEPGQMLLLRSRMLRPGWGPWEPQQSRTWELGFCQGPNPWGLLPMPTCAPPSPAPAGGLPLSHVQPPLARSVTQGGVGTLSLPPALLLRVGQTSLLLWGVSRHQTSALALPCGGLSQHRAWCGRCPSLPRDARGGFLLFS